MQVQDQKVTFNIFKTIKFPSDTNNRFTLSIVEQIAENIKEDLDPLEETLTGKDNVEKVEDDEVLEIINFLETPWKSFITRQFVALDMTTCGGPQKPSIEEPLNLELKPLPHYLVMFSFKIKPNCLS